jgi:hypothetical protein
LPRSKQALHAGECGDAEHDDRGKMVIKEEGKEEGAEMMHGMRSC